MNQVLLFSMSTTSTNKTMKSILFICFLYICLSFLVIGCTDADPKPTCIQAEVVGPDCKAGWYILKLEQEAFNKTGEYIGQLQSGYVTTDNLPDAYKEPGLRIGVAVELNGEYSPTCLTLTVIYPAVRVKRVCEVVPVVAD